LTDPLFYVIMVHIMKKVKSILKKVRPKNGTDIFYTYSNWELHEINGEKFIPVVKEVPDPNKNQVVHFMKKDSMEYVK
jgi:hypothetical protein